VKGLEAGPLTGVFPPEEAPITAPAEINFRAFFSPQLGQTGVLSASENRTILSKVSPQSGQRYSYKGILFIP
jgi:hypothetical protein